MQLKTYTRLLPLVIIIILLAALSACHKSAGTDPIIKDNGKIVYVAGVVDSALNTRDARRAVYWKDGKQVTLPYQNFTPDYNEPSDVLAMTAIGKDIYIGGGNYNHEGYWKNGKFTSLAAADGLTTRSMANNGTDVFTSMNTGHGFLMYKNAELLGNGGPSIAVEGSNIYVLALVNMSPFLQVNGVIGDAVSSELAIAELIAVKNGDVYIAGEGYAKTGGDLVVKLLKNNKLIFTANESSGVTGLFINGNDVYMTGYVNSTQAGLWKNGVLTILSSNAYPVAVTVDGDDVYVAGTKTHPGDGTNGHACYWKNGVITELTTQSSFAKAIVVVKN